MYPLSCAARALASNSRFKALSMLLPVLKEASGQAFLPLPLLVGCHAEYLSQLRLSGSAQAPFGW